VLSGWNKNKMGVTMMVIFRGSRSNFEQGMDDFYSPWIGFMEDYNSSNSVVDLVY